MSDKKIIYNAKLTDKSGKAVQLIVLSGKEHLNIEGYQNIVLKNISKTNSNLSKAVNQTIISTRETVRIFLKNHIKYKGGTNLIDDLIKINECANASKTAEYFNQVSKKCDLSVSKDIIQKCVSKAGINKIGMNALLGNILWTCTGLLHNIIIIKLSMNVDEDSAAGYVKSRDIVKQKIFTAKLNLNRAKYLYYYNGYVSGLCTSSSGKTGTFKITNPTPKITVTRKKFFWKDISKTYPMLKRHIHISSGINGLILWTPEDSLMHPCWTFIHEASHKYAMTEDIAYLPGDKYRSQPIDKSVFRFDTPKYTLKDYSAAIYKKNGLVNNADSVASLIMSTFKD